MNKAEREALLLARWQEMTCYEQAARAEGYRYIAGIDEAGRGPLAGPVVAAAVIFPADACIPGVDDSKKLSEKRRLLLETEIKEKALAWSCVAVPPAKIDEINILEAARLAMVQAVESLSVQPDMLLADAMVLPLEIAQQSLIKGDAKSVSIAAASILAKNERDRIMVAYEEEYPGYGFAKHKGYPTAAHREAIRLLGPTPIHRRSFRW